MCCRMSDSIKHVRACPDLSFDLLGLYTFLHSLHSNFSPSRPFVLWFVPACETSLARDKYAMQSTQKAVEGATALYYKWKLRAVAGKQSCFEISGCRTPTGRGGPRAQARARARARAPRERRAPRYQQQQQHTSCVLWSCACVLLAANS